MNTLFTRLLLAAGLSVALTTSLKAVVLTFGDVYSIGLINDGIPSNPSDEAGYINTLLGRPLGSGPTLVGTETYTRTTNVFAPTPAATDVGYLKQDNSNTTFDLGTGGYLYLIGKYDAGNAGTYVWYVGNLSGQVTLPGTFSDGQYGLSHTVAFNPTSSETPGVPDGANTLLLLGGALGMLELARRRWFVMA